MALLNPRNPSELVAAALSPAWRHAEDYGDWWAVLTAINVAICALAAAPGPYGSTTRRDLEDLWELAHIRARGAQKAALVGV